MVQSPFSADTYAVVEPCRGMMDGLMALAAVPKTSYAIVFSLYNGTAWTSPVAIAGLVTQSRALSFFQENFAGSSRLRIVANGLDICSRDYGETWENTV